LGWRGGGVEGLKEEMEEMGLEGAIGRAGLLSNGG